MSSIRKRNDRYQVQVRRRGYTPVSKTFTSRTAAKKWIQVTEADMERGSYAPPPSVIVSEILKRYQQDILPTHKGADVERYRLRRLNKHFGAMRLTDLTPKEIAKYRDIRLNSLPCISQKRTQDSQSYSHHCPKRLGHCPAPESCKNDLLTQGRQGTDKKIRGRGRRETSSFIKSKTPTHHYSCIGNCDAKR